jgi:tripartite-type tricarboxylate transporter receptor subunit TctC
LLSNTLPFVANPALHRKPPYDVIRDFEPVMLMANQGSMIVLHPSVPVRNVRELIALARQGRVRSTTALPAPVPIRISPPSSSA